jgi:hypothetical protein
LSGIVTAQSGTPFTILDSSNPDLGGGSTTRDRVNIVGDPYSGSCPNGFPVGTAQCWVNKSAFAKIVMPNLGNEGRNSLRSASIFNMDTGLSKLFSVTERDRIEFRWEVFNIFNHTNLGVPVTDFTSPSLGQVQSTATSERLMQFALKFTF